MTLRTLIALAGLLPLSGPALFADEEEGIEERQIVCADVEMVTSARFDFTESEMILMCNDRGAEPWREIPLPQKEYFIRNFLEARGYFFPLIERHGTSLIVKVGQVSLIRKITVPDEVAELEPERYWEIYGRPMTPSNLDGLEKWLAKELGRLGYPCARVELKAYPKEQEVVVGFDELRLFQFPEIESEAIVGTVGGVERRYDAFRTGDTYDSFLLDLTARRMMADEIVIATTFSTKCRNNEIAISQRIMSGEPRTLGFGIGFDTEEYAIAEATWKNTRFTELASILSLTAHASYRLQTLTGTFDWYYSPIVVRHFIRSQLIFVRENETEYDSRTIELKSGPSWNFDRLGHFFSLWASPSFGRTITERGLGRGTADSLAMELDLKMMTHEYEYYLTDPREGWEMDLLSSFAKKGIGSDFSANQFQLTATYLKNLFDLDPPIWIWGLRTKALATIKGEDTDADELPAKLRHRLGGSVDLRGFGRKKVPSDGALTAFYVGGELRLSHIIPFGLQPIVFVDFGKYGMENATLNRSAFWSPGGGLHWKSPIGTFRSSLARGFVEGPDQATLSHLEHWQLYFSYGEQF
jgi:translocation and assembly module TamA